MTRPASVKWATASSKRRCRNRAPPSGSSRAETPGDKGSRRIDIRMCSTAVSGSLAKSRRTALRYQQFEEPGFSAMARSIMARDGLRPCLNCHRARAVLLRTSGSSPPRRSARWASSRPCRLSASGSSDQPQVRMKLWHQAAELAAMAKRGSRLEGAVQQIERFGHLGSSMGVGEGHGAQPEVIAADVVGRAQHGPPDFGSAAPPAR